MTTAEPSVFHLHLVSDATGETLNAVAKAACAQFEVPAVEHVHSLVRTTRQLDRVLKEIEDHPGLVMYTMVNPELRDALVAGCQALRITTIAVLEPVLSAMARFLGRERTGRPGRQHALDAEYFHRIDALNYTMAHDDGQMFDDLEQADVVLVGVSRTSKTPTSIYLANRGIKTANIPLVPGRPLPDTLNELKRPLIVGLIVSPDRLMQIRRNRLIALNENGPSDYADLATIREEILAARRFFERHKWPVIDVSRRSIEETAAAILHLYAQLQAKNRGDTV
jgi:regulator of PEP synthase PpsR (kinase-PPPase family)